MAETQKKGSSAKLIVSHLISIGFAIFLVAYYYFNWIEQAQGISKYLDAFIRAICILMIALEINRIGAAIIGRIKLKDAQKKTTVGLVVSICKVAIVVVAIVLILTLFIEDTSSLFTGIGLLGMVIGLGCNKLIADVVAGIFIVIEGTYRVGDTVVINGTKGEIQTVGIRTTRLLDKENNLRIFNNSSISSVTNNSMTTSGALVEIGIDYSEDIDRVEAILKEALPKMKEEIPTIIAGPFYKGVQELADSAVILRFIAYTTEDDRGKTRRAMNKKLKKLFDENHISIPYPQMVITKRED